MIEPTSIDLMEFLTTWYGPPGKDPTPLPNSCDWLPRPLREWHVLASRWDMPLTSVTWMIPPEQIKIDDGKAIFMEDATGDWRWSFDPDDPDSVFEAELYEHWQPVPERLPVFLVHSAVKQVFYTATARMRAFAVPTKVLMEILAPLQEVAFGAWRWPGPGERIFMGDNVLVEVVPSEYEPEWFVAAAAPEFNRLSGLENIAGVHWRRY